MSPTLKQKLKSSLCICGCFRQVHHHHHAPSQPLSPSSSPESPGDKSSHDDLTASPKERHIHKKTKSPRLSRTLSKSQEKCRSLIQRIGGGSGVGLSGRSGRHVRRHSTDFHYDAHSYSLNFDKGDDEDLDQYPLRNFSSRLPHSPPSSAKDSTETEAESTSAAGREIFAAHC